METLRQGQDPRKVLRRHRERGPIRYHYTADDIARAASCSVVTVRRAQRSGLKLADFGAVARWVAGRIGSQVLG